MSLDLSIRDHGELQAAVLRTTVAGAAGGLLAWRLPGPGAQAVSLLLLGLAAVPPKSWRSAALAATVAVLGGVAWAFGGALGAWGFAAVGGLTFARELPGTSRRAVAAVAGGVGLATALFVALSIGSSGVLGFLPPGLVALALGGAAGFVASLGVTGRELEWSRDEEPMLPAASAVAKEGGLPATAGGGELHGLLGRASEAYREVRAALGGEAPEVSAAAEDLLGRITRFGKRWSDLEAEAARTDRLALAGRLDQIVTREEAAKDDVVRSEYGRARAAMATQLAYLDGIERGRERAVARLHHHIAVMERLRLAALHHRSADAARLGEELAPLVEDLTAAGRELDTAAEVIAELPALTA
ncbi:MAG: hypothetical protein EXR72_04800 [Myxococcales bacterium]|nr:hypothetical protein [Myxococcales bacterium]